MHWQQPCRWRPQSQTPKEWERATAGTCQNHQQSRRRACPCARRIASEDPCRCRLCGASALQASSTPPPLDRRAWRSRHRSNQRHSCIGGCRAFQRTSHAMSSRSGIRRGHNAGRSNRPHTRTCWVRCRCRVSRIQQEGSTRHSRIESQTIPPHTGRWARCSS